MTKQQTIAERHAIMAERALLAIEAKHADKLEDTMGHALTLDEAKALRPGNTVYSLRSANRKGEPHHVKVNGQVKTWKRDTSRVQVPWKFGLYDHGYITEHNLSEFSLNYDYAKRSVRS